MQKNTSSSFVFFNHVTLQYPKMILYTTVTQLPEYIVPQIKVVYFQI